MSDDPRYPAESVRPRRLDRLEDGRFARETFAPGAKPRQLRDEDRTARATRRDQNDHVPRRRPPWRYEQRRERPVEAEAAELEPVAVRAQEPHDHVHRAPRSARSLRRPTMLTCGT